MPGGAYFHKVFVAVVILCKKDEVIIISVIGILEFMVVMPRDIHLAADNGLNFRMFRGKFEKLLHPVHISVIRYRNAGHTEFFGPVKKFRNRRKSVKDRILGMYVEMDEGHNTRNKGLRERGSGQTRIFCCSKTLSPSRIWDNC